MIPLCSIEYYLSTWVEIYRTRKIWKRCSDPHLNIVTERSPQAWSPARSKQDGLSAKMEKIYSIRTAVNVAYMEKNWVPFGVVLQGKFFTQNKNLGVTTAVNVAYMERGKIRLTRFFFLKSEKEVYWWETGKDRGVRGQVVLMMLVNIYIYVRDQKIKSTNNNLAGRTTTKTLWKHPTACTHKHARLTNLYHGK